MRVGLITELERLENRLRDLEESVARTGSPYAEKHGRLRHYCDKVKAVIERYGTLLWEYPYTKREYFDVHDQNVREILDELDDHSSAYREWLQEGDGPGRRATTKVH